MTGFVEPEPSSRGHSSDHIDLMGVREVLLMIVRGTRSPLGGLGYLCVQDALTIHSGLRCGSCPCERDVVRSVQGPRIRPSSLLYRLLRLRRFE